MAPELNGRLRFSRVLPSMHIALWMVSFVGAKLTRSQGLDIVGQVLGILDFPVSLLTMILAWVLPVWIEIVGFALLGTLWWYYLGSKVDLWVEARARPRTIH